MSDHITVTPDRTIDGVPVAGRAAIAAATGKSRQTIDRAASTGDPDFPKPHPDWRVDQAWWYPVDAIAAYAHVVAARDAAKKAKIGTDGQPGELLSTQAAAEEIGVSYPTFRNYVSDSEPYWAKGEPGRLPLPDEEEPRGTKLVTRRWRRDTLQKHQATLPGRGAGAGRRTAAALAPQQSPPPTASRRGGISMPKPRCYGTNTTPKIPHNQSEANFSQVCNPRESFKNITGNDKALSFPVMKLRKIEGVS